MIQWRSQPDNLVMLCKFFCVYRPYKESISKKMNNDNDLNLHSMTKLSGWLRYWDDSLLVLKFIVGTRTGQHVLFPISYNNSKLNIVDEITIILIVGRA